MSDNFSLGAVDPATIAKQLDEAIVGLNAVIGVLETLPIIPESLQKNLVEAQHVLAVIKQILDKVAS